MALSTRIAESSQYGKRRVSSTTYLNHFGVPVALHYCAWHCDGPNISTGITIKGHKTIVLKRVFVLFIVNMVPFVLDTCIRPLDAV